MPPKRGETPAERAAREKLEDFSAFLTACKMGNMEAFERHARSPTFREKLRSHTREGNSPLHLAVLEGQRAIVARLIQYPETDLYAKANRGEMGWLTALQLAEGTYYLLNILRNSGTPGLSETDRQCLARYEAKDPTTHQDFLTYVRRVYYERSYAYQAELLLRGSWALLSSVRPPTQEQLHSLYGKAHTRTLTCLTKTAICLTCTSKRKRRVAPPQPGYGEQARQLLNSTWAMVTSVRTPTLAEVRGVCAIGIAYLGCKIRATRAETAAAELLREEDSRGTSATRATSSVRRRRPKGSPSGTALADGKIGPSHEAAPASEADSDVDLDSATASGFVRLPQTSHRAKEGTESAIARETRGKRAPSDTSSLGSRSTASGSHGSGLTAASSSIESGSSGAMSLSTARPAVVTAAAIRVKPPATSASPTAVKTTAAAPTLSHLELHITGVLALIERHKGAWARGKLRRYLESSPVDTWKDDPTHAAWIFNAALHKFATELPATDSALKDELAQYYFLPLPLTTPAVSWTYPSLLSKEEWAILGKKSTFIAGAANLNLKDANDCDFVSFSTDPVETFYAHIRAGISHEEPSWPQLQHHQVVSHRDVLDRSPLKIDLTCYGSETTAISNAATRLLNVSCILVNPHSRSAVIPHEVMPSLLAKKLTFIPDPAKERIEARDLVYLTKHIARFANIPGWTIDIASFPTSIRSACQNAWETKTPLSFEAARAYLAPPPIIAAHTVAHTHTPAPQAVFFGGYTIPTSPAATSAEFRA